MAARSSPASPALTTAAICAAAVSAQFIAGKATRDALFLASLDVTALPAMVVATAIFSIGLVALSSHCLRRISPATIIPAAFSINALLLLAEWALAPIAPAWAARAIYLQVSGLGPMLGSGFWLLATERFDPHTARHQFGRLAAISALSGLGGALLAERVGALAGVHAMLPLIAALSLVCAIQTRRLAASNQTARRGGPGAVRPPADQPADLAAESPRSGLRVLAGTPYLRDLAALVLLGAAGATLADYVFKVQAVEALGSGDALLRFFALYYAAVSLLAFAVQTGLGQAALERLGLVLTTSTPALALGAGGLGAIVFPGLPGAMTARLGEAVFRGSLFRTGYEIFYTPVPASEKRAAKSLIDVGCERLGDVVGGGLVRLLLLLPAGRQYVAILLAAVACAALALVATRRLSRGYIQTLERSLLNRAVELDLSGVQDVTTRTIALRTLHGPTLTGFTREALPAGRAGASAVPEAAPGDPEMQDILVLRSRDRARVLQVLRHERPLPPALVPHVIPLLAWDAVAEAAVRALRGVAEERVGQLTDALIDPDQPFAVRRRLARVFSVCVSQRAADGLLLGLEDTRFEVRFQCGRSLAALLDRNGWIRIDRDRVFSVVRREVAVGRPVWESHRLLDALADDRTSFVDEYLKDRAGQSLGHVFTLLSLVLPATPLQIAYRGLHTSDPALRGTAIEYLEGVLPPDIRERLWPFLGTEGAPAHGSRGREEILADLFRSNESMVLNLEELRRRRGAAS